MPIFKAGVVDDFQDIRNRFLRSYRLGTRSIRVELGAGPLETPDLILGHFMTVS